MAQSTTESITTESRVNKLNKLISSPSILPIVVLLLTFSIYTGTLNYEFVYDDVTQIVNNHRIKDWSYIPDYFVSHIWVHRDPGENGNYYRPVFLIWLLINYKLFGLNPWSWHFVTVLVHLVATFAIFLLAERLTRDRLTAFFTSLIFGLHPVHIETVAWVSGVTEPLMAVPLIFAFLAYLNNREGRPKARLWFLLSLALYSIALLEKETSVVLIGFIFAHEWLFKKGALKEHTQRARLALIRTIPYLTVTALYLMARTIALNGFSHVSKENNFPFSVTLTTLPGAVWAYIKLLIFPVGLSADYDTPMVKSPEFWNFYYPALIVASISAGLWKVSRGKPVVQFGILLFLFPLLPVLRLSIFGDGFLHDRYLYLPSVGFSLLVAMAIRQLPAGTEKVFGQPARYVAAALVLSCLLVPATTFQTYFWEDDVKLNYRRMETAPNRPDLRFNFAGILFEKKRYEEAAAQYEKIVELHPQEYTSNCRIGYIAMLSGDLDKAELHLRKAIDTSSGKSSYPHLILGYVLKEANRPDEAIQSWRMALEVNSKTPRAHYGIGFIFREQGKPAHALEEFNAELEINPSLPGLRDHIAETEALVKETSLKKEAPLQSVNQQAKLHR